MECYAMESGGESQLIPLVVDMHGPRLANKNEHVMLQETMMMRTAFVTGIFTNMKPKDDLLSWRK